MINEKMLSYGSSRSVIRELFEYGNELRREKGEDAVFDFTLGNPSVLPPKELDETLIRLIKKEGIHGYTSAQGLPSAREKIARYLNERFHADYSADGIIMTVGAAASLAVVFKAIVSSPKEEIAVLKPYFPEYKVFIESAGAKCVEVDFKEEDLSVDLDDFSSKINENTVAVVINSPNNPTGKIYDEKTIEKISELLKKRQREYGKAIYLISDEPYREILFDGATLPFIAGKYENTVTCYSYSKSLSMPGERIGYIATLPQVEDYKKLNSAFLGAARSNGYVCAPSLFQNAVAELTGVYSDTEVYKRNRDILIENLTEYGYKCYKPEGAFYLFVKSPIKSEEFSSEAKKYGLLVVPADSFGAAGYLRIATCVKTETVKRALPVFKELAKKFIK